MQISISMDKSEQTHSAEASALSEAQKAYREFFMDRLEAFGVSSPASLTDEVKSEFFSGITEAWNAYKEENNIQTQD